MFQASACAQASWRLLTLVGSACSVLSAAQAQSASFTPTASQSVVMVAARIPQTADRVTADVVVIERDTLTRLPADNLADALQALAGVQVSRTGGPGQPTSVLIRGAAASNTLVLIDGVRVGSATLGQFDFSTIGLASIERIEVLRGPGASLYGADAVGGVVLVTTRSALLPDDVRHRASASAGNLSSSEAAASTQWAHGAWDGQVQWSRQASGGVSAVRPGDRFGNHNPDRDGYRRQTLQAAAGWRPTEGHRIEGSVLQADLFSRYDASEFAPPDFMPNPRLDFSTRTTTQATALRYEGRAGAWQWRARAGHGVEDSASGARLIDRYRTDRQESGVQLAWQAARGHELVAAWDRLEEQARTDNYLGPGRRDNNALTVAYSGQFGALQVQLDGREDRNSVYGDHRTGRSGLRWVLTPDTSVRLQAATTFRAPSFNELLFPGFGVTTLSPEFGKSLEAGLSQRLGLTQWQATLWRNRVDNLIAYTGDPARCPRTPAYAFGCAANIGRAELQGLTLEVQGRWGSGAKGDTWRLAYDGVDARDGQGQTLPRRARHQWRLQTQHAWAGWQVGSAWVWQSERREAGTVLRGGTRLDLQAVRPLGTSPHWSVRLAMLNALDRDFEPARDYRMPGRQWLLGLRWEGR